MDEAEVVAHQSLNEKYLRQFTNFLDGYSSLLQDLLKDKKSRKSFSDLSSRHAFANFLFDLSSDCIELTVDRPSDPDSATLPNIIFATEEDAGEVEKVLFVLSTLVGQLEEMRREGVGDFLMNLVFYGETTTTIDDESQSACEGAAHVSIASFLPLLKQLLVFSTAVTALVIHATEQLGTLFKDSLPYVVPVAGTNIPSFFRALGDLLGFLVILDEIIGSQTTLQEHWTMYKRMIKSVRADSKTFGVAADDLLAHEKALIELDTDVMAGRMFRSVLDKVQKNLGKTLGKNSTLADRFVHQCGHLGENLDKDFLDGSDEFRPVSLSALFIFATHLFGAVIEEKKLFRTVWEPLKKIPSVHVGGSTVWAPDVFIASFPVGKAIEQPRKAADQATARHAFLQSKVAKLGSDLSTEQIALAAWTCRVQETFVGKRASQLSQQDLSKRWNLLSQGLGFAQRLSLDFRLLLNLHATLGRSLTKQLVNQLCQILQVLKTIQAIFFRFNVQITSSINLIVQNRTYIALQNVVRFRRAVEAGKIECREEVHRLLNQLDGALRRGRPSRNVTIVGRLAFEWAAGLTIKLWRGKEKDDFVFNIGNSLDQIVTLLNMQHRVDELADGSALFWHRVILPSYFASLYENGDVGKLGSFFLLVDDCLRLLNQTHPLSIPPFLADMEGFLKSEIEEKLCSDVETDLRLLTHSHLQSKTSQISPFRMPSKQLPTLVATLSFPFKNRKVCLRQIVERYLSKTFYNLASVALHDWQSYSTMRVLAKKKYNLTILEDHLPGHSLEQGLDILEIVRNLGKFVMEFSYNLNNQVFVQVSSPNKHLDTVNIRHLANSMRTHGPGMANTIVNSTYVFLKSKISALRQFLYGEQIKSKLAKDAREMKQRRQEGRNPSQQPPSNYTYEKAYKFQQGFRRGLNPDQLSRLDHFRILITQIGNALGFVRLVRSGGLHFLASGCRFVPDLEDIPTFKDLLGNVKDVEKELEEAGRNVDISLSTLTSSFSGGADYFSLLVTPFRTACLDEGNEHLKNFYVIIPALTLSYVDHMRSCKEKLMKKATTSNVFTDDGFPMGVAYLLKVMDQDEEFDSLHWFAIATKHHEDEKQKAMKIISEARKDEKLQNASSLTAKRHHLLFEEFRLLQFSLSSARTFFQHSAIPL